MKVVALAGGTGSAKLLRGLASSVRELTVVANVGDNFWVHGLYVCPDVDIAMYNLAGISDRRRGWGMRGDTFAVLAQLGRLGEETWFQLGDLDLATSIVRTALLRRGASLTEATSRIGRSLGVPHRVLPATDTDLETWLETDIGRIHLQEYWVKHHGKPRVSRVIYRGAAKAKPSPPVKEAISRADVIVICPANPVTSIGPMLAIRGMRQALSTCTARVVALSPMVGRGPFSGPAGRLMKQLGMRPDSAGVAALYSDFLDRFVIDRSDRSLVGRVEDTGVSCSLLNTFMKDRADERRVASVLLRD